MLTTIQKYFYSNGYLELPNIGVLKIHKKPAYQEEDNFFPSMEEIILVTGINETALKPPKQFYFLLGEDLGISYENAIIEYDKFINTLFSSELATLDLGTIGFINKSAAGYQFNSKYQHVLYVDTLSINKVKQTYVNPNDDIPTSINKWWIWPLVLAILAILAIILR